MSKIFSQLGWLSYPQMIMAYSIKMVYRINNNLPVCVFGLVKLWFIGLCGFRRMNLIGYRLGNYLTVCGFVFMQH